MAPHQSIAEAQDFRTFRLGGREAAAALSDLARAAQRAADPELARILLDLGRRLGAGDTVGGLIAGARNGEAELPGLALGVRFRAEGIVDAVLGRLLEADSLATRRIHFALLIALGGCADLREALAAQLTRLLTDSRWYAVRNAVVLLSAIGAGVPRRHWRSLAASPHRQLRLALAQEVARWTPDLEALEALIPLLDDGDEGVRFTAAVALGEYVGARAKRALLRRARVEADADVAGVCETSLRRKTLPVAG